MTKTMARITDRITIAHTGYDGGHLSTMSQSITASNESVERYLGGWFSALLTNHGPLHFKRSDQNWNHDVIYTAFTPDGNFVGSLCFIDPPFTIAL